ncbi:MAG: hypothetical protein KDB22_27595 [Planctomycetales bacterium]|nr:hypothetical protein [Planctomycetales bacterium]
MSSYRTNAGEVATELRWTFFRFLPIVLAVVVVVFVVGFGLRSVGLVGGTVVERKVFEASYQRRSALAAQIATDEAVLAEISRQLANQRLDDGTRHNLEAQAAAARVRITTTKGKQQ